ncbi:MAG: uroporphyrinogen-III C-methyltransferase [Alphaproteobacteria bacterium]|jgi:uroporphyrin-III C-methyltransferase|nr:uroporphyrinogen-III C-methyltransferase [Alphaproteobacteria bacterium]HJP23220.1 uroporphyrinogen-III C-methyltransferase [Alphaproteobacteria bacterium]
MTEFPFALPDFEPGWVWLVGAGPGEPGLCTLLGYHALRTADVVIYDALVGKEILELARDGAELEFSGKRGGRPSPSQPNISRRLVQLAREGKRVLRLKGGDPLVFGRGGEESLALVEAGVPFRIVPGISAGVGGAAYAGIPVTHRDVNSVVTFLTGHASTGEVPDGIDWQALAKASPVIVLYMAIKHLGTISGHLIAGGRSADEPVAVIAKATTAEQKVVETTLGRCVADLAQSGLEPPAIVVIGEVVKLRAGLDWLGALSGRVLEADPLGLKNQSDTA